jgi:hypothetical protein
VTRVTGTQQQLDYAGLKASQGLGMSAKKQPPHISAAAKKKLVTEIVQKSWGRIIEIVNKILEAHDSFGFDKFEAGMNPTLAAMLKGLTLVEFILTTFVESDELEYEEVRQALNSKQCIVHMRMLNTALEQKDQEAFESCIKLLNKQTKF